MSKHTPTQWQLGRGGKRFYLTEPVAGGGENQVAEIVTGDEHVALLIAAAPEMYEALLSVKAWLEQLRDLHKASENNHTEWPMPGMSARYREVCAALARAEGR